jgi:hypothetical protein
MELDAGTELEVTHGRQADRSQPRREARDMAAHDVARGTGEGARCEAQDTGCTARGRQVSPIQKGWTPSGYHYRCSREHGSLVLWATVNRVRLQAM